MEVCKLFNEIILYWFVTKSIHAVIGLRELVVFIGHKVFANIKSFYALNERLVCFGLNLIFHSQMCKTFSRFLETYASLLFEL